MNEVNVPLYRRWWMWLALGLSGGLAGGLSFFQ